VTDESGAVMKSKLHAGDRFYTPVELLEEARLRRVIYTPRGLRE